MTLEMKGNWIFARTGEKAFKVASNYTNYVEVGARNLTDYYLEARIESDGFTVDATLRGSNGREVCRVVRNFPTAQDCVRELTPRGYRIKTLDQPTTILLELVAVANVCSIKTTIYDGKGRLIAGDVGDDFLIYQGPAILGKSGRRLGIVIGP